MPSAFYMLFSTKSVREVYIVQKIDAPVIFDVKQTLKDGGFCRRKMYETLGHLS